MDDPVSETQYQPSGRFSWFHMLSHALKPWQGDRIVVWTKACSDWMHFCERFVCPWLSSVAVFCGFIICVEIWVKILLKGYATTVVIQSGVLQALAFFSIKKIY